MKRELVFFLISGCSAVLTDLISYFLLVNSLGHDYAKALSFVLGSFVAFILNKYLTFQKKESSITEVIKFSILYALTLGANVTVNPPNLHSQKKHRSKHKSPIIGCFRGWDYRRLT